MSLSASKTNFFDLCDNNRIARESCKQLRSVVNQSELLQSESTQIIDEYFAKLKEEIDAKKELYIKMINDDHEKIIKEMEQLQANCKLESETKKAAIDAKLKTSVHKLEEWNEELKIQDYIHNEYWKDVVIRSQQEIDLIQYLYKKYRDDALLHKEFKFAARAVVNDNHFGELAISDVERLNENRSEATFQLKIDDFYFFKDEFDSRETINFSMIKNIPWRIEAKIERTKDLHIGLGFYVYPDVDDEQLAANPVNTETTFRIIPHRDDATKLEKTLTHKFENNLGHGFSPICLLRELLDSKSGLYDSVNDSITLEAHLKVLD